MPSFIVKNDKMFVKQLSHKFYGKRKRRERIQAEEARQLLLFDPVDLTPREKPQRTKRIYKQRTMLKRMTKKRT